MMRHVPYASVGAATFAAFMALSAWLALHGFQGAETNDLAGRGIAARDGLVSLREIALAFPPLPYLATLALQIATPGSLPAPTLIAAAAMAALAALWTRSFARAGYRWATALAMALLLAANPVLLSLAFSGPSAPMLTLGAWLMAASAYRLRARANIVDLMGFSGCLALLALCHPFAILIVIAFAPFIILALPPQVTAESTVGAYLTALFPFLLVIGGAAYVSWIFTGDMLGLARTIGAQTGDLNFEAIAHAPISYERLGALGAWPLYGLIAIVNAPILFAGLALARRRLPRIQPMLALAATAPLAAITADMLGLSAPPLLLVAPLIGFAAATLAILPVEEQRPILALLLVAAGALGGALTLRLAPSAESASWVAAMSGEPVTAARAADLALGRALAHRNDVLVDTASSPAVVAGRQSASGLVGPLAPAFEMTRMSLRPATRYLAVRNAEGLRRETDAVHAIFPNLYAKGMKNYARVYDHAGWRVYERLSMVGER